MCLPNKRVYRCAPSPYRALWGTNRLDKLLRNSSLSWNSTLIMKKRHSIKMIIQKRLNFQFFLPVNPGTGIFLIYEVTFIFAGASINIRLALLRPNITETTHEKKGLHGSVISWNESRRNVDRIWCWMVQIGEGRTLQIFERTLTPWCIPSVSEREIT